MHIKLLYRKVLYVFLSLMIVISSTQSAYSASPVGWVASPADIIMNGATAIITAFKGAGTSALQSTVQHAPTVANIGKNIVKGAGAVAVAYAVTEIIGAGIDWVLDPANNRIKYAVPDTSQPLGYLWKSRQTAPFATFNNPSDACLHTPYSWAVVTGVTRPNGEGVEQCQIKANAGGAISFNHNVYRISEPPPVIEKYIPISTVASKVQSNAAAGHAPSKELIKTVVLDDVNAGLVDTSLNINAVPRVDDPTAPVPPVDPTLPFDPSSIIAAIKSVMSAVTNMSGTLGAKIESLMTEMGLQNAETQRVINDGMADVVAAIEAIEGNTLDGQVINDAIDRAIAEGKTNTSDIVAAIEAIEGNTLDGQVINDAVDRVIANDNVNVQSAADAADVAADAAKAADAANTAAVTDAIDAQTDAISQTDPDTGEKSLKLPTFCGWAGTVCDYMDWVKGEYQTMSDFVKAEPETMPDEPVVIADDPSGLGGVFQDKAEAGYVSFARQCPDNVLIPVSLMGASQSLNISYAPFCHFASLIRPAVILGAWISGLLIISGGRARE